MKPKVKSQKSKVKKSFGLLEVVLSVAIIFIVMFSLSQAAILFLRLIIISEPPQRAVFLAQEGIEAVRFLRDVSWTNNIATSSVVVGNSYYPVASGSTWLLKTADPGSLLGRFTRTVVFNSVNRDASGNIVASGGTPDPDTRKVTATIAWINEQGQSQNYSLNVYITNFLNN